MTDLIKELRGLSAGPSSEMERIGNKAADHIEELVKERDISRMASVVMDNTVEELLSALVQVVDALERAVVAEAKLAECEARLSKAVAGLRKIADYKHFSRHQGWIQNTEARIAIATLAELEK